MQGEGGGQCKDKEKKNIGMVSAAWHAKTIHSIQGGYWPNNSGVAQYLTSHGHYVSQLQIININVG